MQRVKRLSPGSATEATALSAAKSGCRLSRRLRLVIARNVFADDYDVAFLQIP
jgi:hypothetical protein